MGFHITFTSTATVIPAELVTSGKAMISLSHLERGEKKGEGESLCTFHSEVTTSLEHLSPHYELIGHWEQSEK